MPISFLFVVRCSREVAGQSPIPEAEVHVSLVAWICARQGIHGSSIVQKKAARPGHQLFVGSGHFCAAMAVRIPPMERI